MKTLTEGDAMDDDILKTLKESKDKQKWDIQGKTAASGSTESKVFMLIN